MSLVYIYIYFFFFFFLSYWKSLIVPSMLLSAYGNVQGVKGAHT